MHLGTHHPLNLVPLAYVHWFTRPLPQPERNLKMYFVKRLLRNDQSPVTDIIDVESIARFIQVIPKFPSNTKELANTDADLIMDRGIPFFITPFTDKEIFQSVY
jgi:hypothetical protein